MATDSQAIQAGFEAFLRRMSQKFAEHPFLRAEAAVLDELAGGVRKPFTLAVFGRMKTGKSSLINAMVGRPLTITGVEEATATVNWISYGTPEQEQTMLAHWRDGRVDPMPVGRLSEWVGKEDSVLERVRATAFLQLYSNAPALKQVQIVDTPGTGSVAAEHEEVARRFLNPGAAVESEEEGRKADALVYVFPPVARERDEESLENFRQTRLPGSDPYNSIGVLHKWDGLESDDPALEAERKAERLRGVLKDVVSDVIPVSAPLAMAARHAPEGFFEKMLEVTAGDAGTVFAALRRDNRWDDEPGRREARVSYPLPWVSFKRLARLLTDRHPGDVAAARSLALEASGILHLEEALDRRFFRKSAVIKQRLARVKATEAVQRGLMILNDRLAELETDCRQLGILETSASHPPQTAQWISKRRSDTETDRRDLEEWAIEADRGWLEEREKMDLLERDLSFLDAMERSPGMVEPADAETIRILIQADGGDVLQVSSVVLGVLVNRYGSRIHDPSLQTRRHFEHLIQRLHQAMNSIAPA